MSPVDDELRARLRARTAAIPAAPDPLAGIKPRACRLRQRGVDASLAGTALAVAAIAAVVPALASGPSTARLSQTPPSTSASAWVPSPLMPSVVLPSVVLPSVVPPSVVPPSLSVPPVLLATPVASSSPVPSSPVPSATTVPSNGAGPGNLIRDWSQRGDRAAGPDESQVVTLFAGKTTGGLRYTMGQPYFRDDGVADDVSATTSGVNGPEFPWESRQTTKRSRWPSCCVASPGRPKTPWWSFRSRAQVGCPTPQYQRRFCSRR